MKRLFLVITVLFFSTLCFAQDAAEKINQANELMKAKDYAGAFKLYDEAMKNLGDVQIDKAINYNIGFAALQSENYPAAIAYFDKAIEAGTNIPKAWEYKANAYNKLEDYKNCVASYEKAAETATPEDAPELVFNAAVSAYKGEMMDKAISLFDKSIANNYKPETAYYYKAIVLKKQGNEDLYKATLTEGAEKFPGDEKIGSSLAKIYVAEGNALYKEGVGVLNAANQKVKGGTLKTTDAAYNDEVAKAKTSFKAASEILEKAVKLDPANANAAKLLEACKQNLSI